MMPPLVLFLIPLGVLTVGAVLISIGRRGRAVDNHPICKRCGFDLFGLHELTKCPECGVELSSKMIRLGHRKVRKLPLIFGVFMVLPSAALLAIVAIAAVRQTDLNRYKPLWLLLREKDRPALLEINRRFAANQLDRAQTDRVTAAALAVQADTSVPFLFEWGNFIETARAAGMVDDESWKRYAKQSIPLQLIARANVRRGDPVPIRFHYGPTRLGRGYNFRAEMSVAGSSLGGVPLSGTTRTNFGISDTTGGTDMNCRLVIPPDKLATLSDGPNPLRVTVRVTIQEAQAPPHSNRTKDLVTHDVETTAMVNVVPADQPTVQVVTDPGRRTDVEACLTLKGWREPRVFVSWDHGDWGVGRDVHVSKDAWGNDHALFLIAVQRPPPIGLAFDVSVIDRSVRAWPSDSVAIDAGANWGSVCRGAWDGFNADKVDVLLKPNPAVAAATVGITQIWGGEIRFRDVPVVWDKNAHRPTTLPDWEIRRRAATMRAATSPTASPATTKASR